jgi:hypothetical protein
MVKLHDVKTKTPCVSKEIYVRAKGFVEKKGVNVCTTQIFVALKIWNLKF